MTALTTIIATLAITSSAQASSSWQWKYKAWMPAVWQRVAQCESGSNPPNWKHDSGTYQGAFGFYHGSWDAFRPARYPSNAADASPWQQYRVALRIHARYGFTGWGCYRHSWVRNG